MRRIQLGLIPDNIPERLIATRTPVASVLRLPPRALQFVEQNYLPVAYRLRVLGKTLGVRDIDTPATYQFEVVVPAQYKIVAQSGEVAALLDGTPLGQNRYLDAGRHQAIVSRGEGRIDLIWAHAIEKGFSPFSPVALDITTASD